MDRDCITVVSNDWLNNIHFLDRQDSIDIRFRKLPHWSQPGTLAFITWRTADSMPREVFLQFRKKRFALIRNAGADPETHWQTALAKQAPQALHQVELELFETWDRYLDACEGACVLRQSEMISIVAESLIRFNHDRYLITDYIVMPNHIHIIAAFDREDRMLLQGTSWKRFTGRAINQKLRRTGKFWQPDQFDHLIRDELHFEYYRNYIRNNPMKAKLNLPSEAYYSFDCSRLSPRGALDEPRET